MVPPPGTGFQPSALQGVIRLASLLGIFLYFTGYTYRWSYFGYFQIDIITLNLSQQSFLLVPLQVFLGTPGATVRATALFIVGTPLLASIFFIAPVVRERLQGEGWPEADREPRQLFAARLAYIAGHLFRPIAADIVVVTLTLAALFWLARAQGIEDARRDAFDATSTLPVATFINPTKKFSLGRNLEQPLLNMQTDSFQVLGDLELYRQLQGRDLNDYSIDTQPVWRLLLDSGDWLYLVPTVPSGIAREADIHPPVLALSKGEEGSQMLMLGPARDSRRDP